MKINKYIVISLIIMAISLNASYSYGGERSALKRQKAKVAKINKVQEEKPAFNNDIHSVFSLKDCIENAIKYNPAIRASLYNEDAYKSKIGQAWANFFPEISAGVQAARNGTKYSKSFPMGYESMYHTMAYVPYVSAGMMIFDFGKTKAVADRAKRTYEAAKEDTKENINAIIYDIKETYYNIIFAQAQVRVYEDTVKDFELQLKQAEGFYRLGKKAKIDVVTAEYNLGNAKLNLVKVKNVLQVARVQLSRIMGIPEYTNYELSDGLSLNKYDITVDDAIKTALNVRPELISAKKDMEAAKMNLRAARRNFTPDLSVFASYENGIGNEYNISTSKLGVDLSYDGLNIARIKKQIDEANAKYKVAQAQYEDVEHEVYYNVKKSYIDLQTAIEEIVIAKLALDQAKEQYRQATGRYKAGVGDAIELKDGENTFLSARLDFYNALLNYNITAATLEKEIGIPLIRSKETILTITPEEI